MLNCTAAYPPTSTALKTILLSPIFKSFSTLQEVGGLLKSALHSGIAIPLTKTLT